MAAMDSCGYVKQLASEGRFIEALTALERISIARADRISADVLRVHLLERLGRCAEARALAEHLAQSKGLTSGDRSACELALGMIDWDEGRSEEAIVHHQRSVSMAEESRDPERLWWAQLRLWDVLSDRSDS